MFRTGQQIGAYTLIQRIGRGGFGEVWLAERRAKFVTTKVAIKFPLEENIDIDAIKQEAILWEKASGHPNVLPIIEADEYDGQVVIVSEYASDGSLEQLLRKTGEALPLEKAIELTIGILNGLEFLHSRQIIHRDLKPANILLQGEAPRLADFGISRAMKTTSMSINVAGTPVYMAPEAFDGKRNVQTDLWSVGVILYQMLSGKLPFSQNSQGELLAAIIMREPQALPDNLPLSLRQIVMRALAKQPNERYKTAREMRDDLNKFLIAFSRTPLTSSSNKKPFVSNYAAQTPTKNPNSQLIIDEQNTKTARELELPYLQEQSKSKSQLSYAWIASVGIGVIIIFVLIGGVNMFNEPIPSKPSVMGNIGQTDKTNQMPVTNINTVPNINIGATNTNTTTSENSNFNYSMTREEVMANRSKVEAEARRAGGSIGQGASDSWIWIKTRSALLSANDLRDSTINVDVNNGVITLKGTVANQQEKASAAKVAQGIEGKTSVSNQLTVNPNASVMGTNSNTGTANQNANTKRP